MRIVRDPFANFPSTTVSKIKEEVKALAERFLYDSGSSNMGLKVVESVQDFLFPRTTIK